MITYKRTRNNLVTIKKINERDIVLDRASCLRATENVKASRADYATEEAYQRYLAMYQDALAHFTRPRHPNPDVLYHTTALPSELERAFLTYWRQLAPGTPEPVCQENGGELMFSVGAGRKHRFDFAWPAQRVAVEMDGGQWKAAGGRHARDADREKHNLAVLLGWRVLRYSGEMLERDPSQCVREIVAVLARRRREESECPR